LLGEAGTAGLLATNTISQGDTREIGLDRLCDSGWAVFRAWKSRPWPGEASLEIAQVWLRRGAWKGQARLDGRDVAGITPALDPRSRTSGKPARLAAARGDSFIGSYLYGEGFLLSPKEARRLLEADGRNYEVVFPYLTGEDLNTSPRLEASRWVVDFDDLSEEQARTYEDCWKILYERVRPERLRQDAKKYPTMVSEWWKFWRRRSELYQAIEGLGRVIVVPRVTKYVVPVFVASGARFADRLVVFAYGEYERLGVLSSHLHTLWVLRNSATFETRPTYNPTDCFETFPQAELTRQVARLAESLDYHRQAMMLEREEGLTRTYNRVHNPEERASDVIQLRRLHLELDRSVADAYGWRDLDLEHQFYETPQGFRYTLGPEMRTEVLDRLLELNQERYTEEVAAGLHGSKGGGKKRRARAGQTSLIDD
jgi:hypothetical protein